MSSLEAPTVSVPLPVALSVKFCEPVRSKPPVPSVSVLPASAKDWDATVGANFKELIVVFAASVVFAVTVALAVAASVPLPTSVA